MKAFVKAIFGQINYTPETFPVALMAASHYWFNGDEENKEVRALRLWSGTDL